MSFCCKKKTTLGTSFLNVGNCDITLSVTRALTLARFGGDAPPLRFFDDSVKMSALSGTGFGIHEFGEYTFGVVLRIGVVYGSTFLHMS